MDKDRVSISSLFAVAVALLHEVVGFRCLELPWTPFALVGAAVAFLIGFQNNAAYGRAWEDRKIWVIGGTRHTELDVER
ncbi:MAG: bestrophin family ion channel [Planctomycetota bacterium]